MSALNLSAEGQQFFCGLAIAGAATMAGGIGVPIATGLVEFATNGGNLALAVAREKQDRCQKLLDGVIRSVEESYQAAWKLNRAQSARGDIEAAFAQLDTALVAIKPTSQEIVDAGFNGQKLYNALKAKLPPDSLFQQSHVAEEVLSKIIIGTYALIRSDQAFAAEFQKLGFERVLDELDALKKQGKAILDAMERSRLEYRISETRQEEAAARRHSEAMDAIIINTGLPVRVLERLFDSVEEEYPDSDIEAKIYQAIAKMESFNSQTFDVGNLGDDIRVLLERASQILSDTKDVDAAIAVFDPALEELEGRMKAGARLAQEKARMLEATYRFDDALAAYAKASRYDPDDIWPHIQSGIIRTHRGNLKGAENHFHDALAVADRTGGDREQMVTNAMQADNLIAQGILDAAAAHQAVMIEAAKRLAEHDPSNSEWLRDLSVSHNKIGDLERARGNLYAALSAFKAGLAIAERLARQDARNTEWQRDLSVSYNRIGDVEVARGNHEEALSAFQATLAINEKFASQDASNTDWQRDLSISHERIGDLERAHGNIDAALSSYQACLAIREQLASQDASNADWQRDLSICHDRIGGLERAHGNIDAALSTYQACLAIREQLASQDASNADWQRDLSVSHNKIGDLERARGNLYAALSAFKAGLAIAERLARQDASNTEWQRDLSVSYNRIGDVEVARGNLDAALSAFKASFAIAEQLSSQDASNSEWQRDLSVSHIKIGDVEKARGNLEAALSAFKASFAIAEQLASQDTSNSEWQRDLSISHDRIGDVEVARGNLEAALSAYRASLALREQLSSQDASNSERQRDLIISNAKLAEYGDAPVSRYKEALRITRALHESGRLAPVDHWMVAQLETRLAALD